MLTIVGFVEANAAFNWRNRRKEERERVPKENKGDKYIYNLDYIHAQLQIMKNNENVKSVR